MSKEIEFLKAFQNELNTQKTDGQAGPRFWSIMDYKWIPASEEHSEKVELYDCEECVTVDINDYVHDIVDFEGERHNEYNSELRNELRDIYQFDTPEEIYEWIKENDDESRYYPVYQQEISFIAYNTCFFTKEEAKRHLESNRHHYSDKAHTFAMTLWRAPEMKMLMNILQNFDWGSVKVKKSAK